MTLETSRNAKIDHDALSLVAAKIGPCLTVVMPDSHPGAAESSRRTWMEGLVKDAKKRALAAPGCVWPASFDDPLGDSPGGGGPGFAVYRTPDSMDSYSVAGDAAKAVFASHPYVLPLLKPAATAQDFFLLGLSKNHIRLLEYVNDACAAVDLPAGIPATLEAASHPRHGTPGEVHTSAGHGMGKMGAMRFGTSGSHETARDQMDHFCVLLDQGLQPLLKGRPLLLMGVKEEIAAYRRVSRYDALLHTEVDGNVESFTLAHIEALARKAASTEYTRLAAEVLAAFREMRDRTRTEHDPREVLKAAFQGRVRQLCVRAGTEILGPLDSEMDRVHLTAEDLLNAAAVETLRHGGEVYILPQEHMPVTEAVCAILRY